MDDQLGSQNGGVAEENEGESVAAAPAGEPVGHDGTRVNIVEKPCASKGGILPFIALILDLLAIGLPVWLFIKAGLMADAGESGVAIRIILGIVLLTLGLIFASSFVVVSPGHTSVRQFFGRYIGTVRKPGLALVQPLSTGKKVSVRVQNFETETLKVNDLNGNPINIAAIIVWQVSETARATFAVENYAEFVETQAEAALRHVTTKYPYDAPTGQKSLLGSTGLVSDELAHEVAERVEIAGIEIVETRISELAYAPEIAHAMLQRQQASAIIDAREQIVEGAVTMVDSALKRLEAEDIVELDEERRAQMVSNLLVVLVSESQTTPVINAGSLYS